MTETAWEITQTADGESYVDYLKGDEMVSEMVSKVDDAEITAIIEYEDPRSEFEKVMSLTTTFSDSDVIDDERATTMHEALAYDNIESHYDDGTGDRLREIGSNWDDATDAEKEAYLLLANKLHRMSYKAGRLLDAKVW